MNAMLDADWKIKGWNTGAAGKCRFIGTGWWTNSTSIESKLLRLWRLDHICVHVNRLIIFPQVTPHFLKFRQLILLISLKLHLPLSGYLFEILKSSLEVIAYLNNTIAKFCVYILVIFACIDYSISLRSSFIVGIFWKRLPEMREEVVHESISRSSFY